MKGKKQINLILKFMKKMKYDRIDVYAAQASFYTIMSAIPILMLMFTLLKFTPLTQEMVMEVLGRIVCPLRRCHFSGFPAKEFWA